MNNPTAGTQEQGAKSHDDYLWLLLNTNCSVEKIVKILPLLWECAKYPFPNPQPQKYEVKTARRRYPNTAHLTYKCKYKYFDYYGISDLPNHIAPAQFTFNIHPSWPRV